MATKLCVVLCCVLVAVLAEDQYTDKYDNFNLKEVLENERLFNAYCNCLLDKGKCSPEGKELREHIQDALETGCSKCTEPQKDGATMVFDHLFKNRLDVWKELCAKYDPTGVWRKKYEDQARERGITIPAE